MPLPDWQYVVDGENGDDENSGHGVAKVQFPQSSKIVLQRHISGPPYHQSLCRVGKRRGRRLLGAFRQVSSFLLITRSYCYWGKSAKPKYTDFHIVLIWKGVRISTDLNQSNNCRYQEAVSLDGFKGRPRALRILGYHNPQESHYEVILAFVIPQYHNATFH